MRKLVVTQTPWSAADDDGPGAADVVSLGQLKREAYSGRLLGRLLRYDDVELRVPRIDGFSRPMASSLLMRGLSRGSCRLRGADGEFTAITWNAVAGRLGRFLRDFAGRSEVRRRLAVRCAELRRGRPDPPAPYRRALPPVYVRSDLNFGLPGGGLLSHLRGVLEGLRDAATAPILLSMEPMAGLAHAADVRPLPVVPDYWDFPETVQMAADDVVVDAAATVLERQPVAFVYHRNVAFALGGLRLARARGVPFVFEYNGSEAWMNRHWGHPLKHEPLADAIEQTNLECADLVVVVSQPLRDELVERGIDADAIVVAPNGADPARFRPDVDGSGVRRDLQLDDAVVVGFVGSFGRWHGAEVLAGSFARLLAAEEASGRRLRLLMIGEGETLPEVKRRLSGTVGEETVRLPGSVAYEQIPAHLAACDILVAPQVENADGSPFFGSPTKLFEYMAMGRAVVASKLGQMADVVADGRSGLLARPGDEADLARAISRLASDQALRCRLGAAARAAVLARHTWRHHVDGILGKLEERCP